MANNGKLTLQDDGTYKGEFHSLKHSFPLQMVPNEDRRSERAPEYKIISGRTVLGSAWEEESAQGVIYYTLQIKDPSFGTLYLKLFQDWKEGGTYNIVFD
jgi:uncharacterized protein (DUF736 family)